MQTVYNVLMFLSLLVAILFGLLVLFTGKGDAMSGGSTSVRTTFKGKASFDDFMSKWTMGLGVTFFILMILIDATGNRLNNAANATTTKKDAQPSSSAPSAPSSPAPAPTKK